MSVKAVSKDRYRATAAERRMYGGSTVTEFYVFRSEDERDPSKWKIVTGYGRTPGDRKTNAIRRSGLAERDQASRDPQRPRQSTSISRGARGMAERGEHARDRFIAYARERADLTRSEAEQALATYKKHRVIRLDHVTGDFYVKHGGFLDRDTLRRAAGIE